MRLRGWYESLISGGVTTTFTWDVARSIPQVLDDGDLRYIYGLGRIGQVDDNELTHYYLNDGLGSTMALTNASKTVVNDYEYEVFGAVSASSGSLANFFEFAGEQSDDSTDLQYLRARYYDPASGRFISQDPWGGTVGVPSTLNRYPYVLSNPANLLDPSGRKPDTTGTCELFNDDPNFCTPTNPYPPSTVDHSCQGDFFECSPLWKITGSQLSKLCKVKGAGKICGGVISGLLKALEVHPLEAPGCEDPTLPACPDTNDPEEITPPSTGNGGGFGGASDRKE